MVSKSVKQFKHRDTCGR